MAYSCTDFVDTILDALGVAVPEEALDDPSAQADLALAAIARLRAGPFYVCAIETKYIDGWHLFTTLEDARAYLQSTALKAWDENGGDLWTDDNEGDLDIVGWFQSRDSTYIASIQELTFEQAGV